MSESSQLQQVGITMVPPTEPRSIIHPSSRSWHDPSPGPGRQQGKTSSTLLSGSTGATYSAMEAGPTHTGPRLH